MMAATAIVVALILLDDSGGRHGSTDSFVVNEPVYSGETALPPDTRAFTLIVDPVTTEGTPVVPGDRVDVTVEGDELTRVVKALQVLAVSRVYPSTIEDETDDGNEGQPAVSFATNPEQARALAEALGIQGRITLTHSS
jgi:Flp pilus assembly protein CpaB